MGCSQVQWGESTIGLGVHLGAVLHETTRHNAVAPSAGAVQGRPAVDRTVIHHGACGEKSPHDFDVTTVCCAVQGGVAVLVTVVHQQRIGN